MLTDAVYAVFTLARNRLRLITNETCFTANHNWNMFILIWAWLKLPSFNPNQTKHVIDVGQKRTGDKTEDPKLALWWNKIFCSNTGLWRDYNSNYYWPSKGIRIFGRTSPQSAGPISTINSKSLLKREYLGTMLLLKAKKKEKKGIKSWWRVGRL